MGNPPPSHRDRPISDDAFRISTTLQPQRRLSNTNIYIRCSIQNIVTDIKSRLDFWKSNECLVTKFMDQLNIATAVSAVQNYR